MLGESSVPNSSLRQWVRDRAKSTGLHVEMFIMRAVARQIGNRNGALYDEHSDDELAFSLRLLDSMGR